MRICRFLADGRPQAGFYSDSYVMPLRAGKDLYGSQARQELDMPCSDDLLDYLPPEGAAHAAAKTLDAWLSARPAGALAEIRLAADEIELLLPVPKPAKLFLIAGNYAEHIREDGEKSEEREDTFPYVFMKPSTALLEPSAALQLPAVSPGHIDWELELAVVIGTTAKNVTEAEALSIVAGYTILNDISDRKFRPNPGRAARPWDKFFDWMHGKWHDGFAPCGPCIVSSDELSDPQSLHLSLELNGQLRQEGSTREQIFPVAAIIAFISSFVTLEPGDIISTGTPAGVGSSTQTFLGPGDTLVGSISRIGKLVTRVE